MIFYESNNLSKIGKSSKISNIGEKIACFDEHLLLIGTQKNVEIYNFEMFKIVKSIFCVYPIRVIYINQNKVFIGESKNYDLSKNGAENRITEYEMDIDGNYKQIYSYNNPHKNELNDITQVKDGRLVTCSNSYVKIWN